ncbi:hypothetical protein CSUNSWCD_2289 [Campylobacter showae CSUNSWCD]|uniref:Uncharacterized protein n=1 Tax=Campylobacter showae CSUNSWCD TaxID=1244083 RepID=M5IQE7_9BACT|nr:hypothetical protein CSUNSWCD_2289 [Campylobacter showae CSUNSWCD]
MSSLDLKFLHNIQIHLKILRLDFTLKFANLTRNFTHRDLHLDGAKFGLVKI